MKNMLKTAGTVLLAALVLGFGGWLAARAGQDTVASRAYVGHENDADMRGFVRHYPATAGTRLDDCQTCHRGGVRGTDTEREVSPCSYCHLIVFPNARYKTGVPGDYEATLNAYGLDYKKAGRAFGSFAAIDGRDSDGDGKPNGIEVADLRNPGDPASRPGLPQAPTVVLGWDEIRGLPVHTQFLLMNKTTAAPRRVRELQGRPRHRPARRRQDRSDRGHGHHGVRAGRLQRRLQPPRTSRRLSPRASITTARSPSRMPERALLEKPEAVPAGVANGQRIPGRPWLVARLRKGGKAPRSFGLRKRDGKARRGRALPAGQAPAGPHGRSGEARPAGQVGQRREVRRRLGLSPTGSTTTPGPAPAAPASSGSTRCPRAARNTTGRTAGRSSASGRS